MSPGASTAVTLPPVANAISLPVIVFRRAASASPRRNPTLSVPRISGGAVPTAIGTLTTCRMPWGPSQNVALSRPSRAS